MLLANITQQSTIIGVIVVEGMPIESASRGFFIEDGKRG